MAEIFPFRAYRYSPKAGELKNLATQPYDKISDELRTNTTRAASGTSPG